MKSTFNTLIIVLATVILAGCKSHEVISISSYQEAPMSEFDFSTFESRTIELQPAPRDTLGIISKVTIFQDRIYILNSTRQQRLSVYSSGGKFISHIGATGQGTGEYTFISDFTVDADGNVWIADGLADKLIQYDSSLQYVSTSEFPFEIDGMASLASGGLLLGLSFLDRSCPEEGVVSTTPDEKPEKILPRAKFYDTEYEIAKSQFQNTGKGYFFNKAIDDNAYLLDKTDGRVIGRYFFDFGAEAVPDERKEDLEKCMVDGTFGQYTMISDFVVVGDRYILGSLIRHTVPVNFIADRRTGTLYTQDMRRTNERFLGYDGDALVSVIMPSEKDARYRLRITDIPLI